MKKELRIGNYLYDIRDRLCKVNEINEVGYGASAIVGAITSLPNLPITLTEDIIK